MEWQLRQVSTMSLGKRKEHQLETATYRGQQTNAPDALGRNTGARESKRI